MHIRLRISEGDEVPEYEPVHARHLGASRYIIEFTPGLAYGIAAGDEIDLAEDGTYEVVARAGNVAVRVLCPNSLTPVETSLTALVATRLGGHLDGRVDRGLAYTIPIRAGFPAIEQVFQDFVASTTGAVWEYGNVYAKDGSPLGWWKNAS